MQYQSHPARPGRPTPFTPFFICASALLWLTFCVSASAQDDRYKLASAADGAAQVAASATSSEAVISADGRFVAFTSEAPDLVALPVNGRNVFVRDLQAGTTRLVSVNKDGTGGGDGASSDPHVSADGRYVAFVSFATDLVADDPTGRGENVFVRDTRANTTILLAANTGGPITENNSSYGPSMTPDGRYVAFTGARPDIYQSAFVRDMQTNTTTLVTVNTSGVPSYGFGPVISANGRVVVFSSQADDLQPIPTAGPTRYTNLFARDLATGMTTLVTVDEMGTGGGNNDSRHPSVSADGRFVAFHSDATNLPSHPGEGTGSGIYVRDVTAGVTTPVAVPDVPNHLDFFRLPPAITPDGRYVAYAYNYFDPLNYGGIARYDRVTGALVTLPPSAPCENANCSILAYRPSLSDDGRFVAFGIQGGVFRNSLFQAAYYGDFLSLTATNVVVETTDRRRPGHSDELAMRPVISADGRSVAFQTRTDFVPQNQDSDALNIYRFTPSNADPAGVAGVIQFGTPTSRVEEDAGSVVIPVMRGTFDGAGGTSSIDFATADGTAQAGRDYAATSGTLTFGPGEDVKFIAVPLFNDTGYEGTETFSVSLSNPTGGYLLGGTNPATTVVIHDSIKPTVTIDDASAKEGEDVVFTVTISEQPVQPIFIGSGTTDGTAEYMQGDYAPRGGSLLFEPGETTQTIHIKTRPDFFINEQDETFFVQLVIPEGLVGLRASATGTIHNNTTPFVQLHGSEVGYFVSEPIGGIVVTAIREGGDTSIPFSVDYSTSDGTASERSDYTAAFGTLTFAAGETEKTITLFFTDDTFAEPQERFYLTLSNPQGAALGSTSTTTVIINSDDTEPWPNPLRDASFLVRQHYRDFLNRDPDPSGLQFWTREIERCGADVQCREVKRVNVSAAFFLSIEFQNTGYFVYLLRQAAFDTGETLGINTFLRDTQEVGRGVVVNQGAWQQQLEVNRQALVARLASSAEFAAAYPASLTAAQYVDALNLHTLDPLDPSSGGALTQAERDALVSDLSSGVKTRADVLRAVAEDAEFGRRQFNKGFVYMQYVGYLRRTPNAPPDSDFTGYRFWLSKLNDFGGDLIRAEMVKAFITSDEYRQRFGQ